MSESGSRPGGLTALAVLNFVFGGLGALGLLALVALFSLANSASGGSVGEEVAKAPNAALIFVGLGVGLVNICLLITSGIGYLQQKRFLGRTLGSAYGVIALVFGIFQLVALNQGFGIGSIIGFIYPVLTLALLNTTFKDDFVNP